MRNLLTTVWFLFGDNCTDCGRDGKLSNILNDPLCPLSVSSFNLFTSSFFISITPLSPCSFLNVSISSYNTSDSRFKLSSSSLDAYSSSSNCMHFQFSLLTSARRCVSLSVSI
eukprot:254962_1